LADRKVPEGDDEEEIESLDVFMEITDITDVRRS
jgi:hypothetical protein